MYKLELFNATGLQSVRTALYSPTVRVKGWSKRINAAGKMVFSLNKFNEKATDDILKAYRPVRLYRKDRDAETYDAVWLGYIEAKREIGDEIEVVCVGMLQLFAKRYTGNNEQFNGAGSDEVFDLLSATNTNDGATGVTAGTGDVTSTKKITMNKRQISRAWEEIARAHNAEYEIDDAGNLNFVSALGADKSASIQLVFRRDGEPGTNLNSIQIGEDGRDMANRIIATTSQGGGFSSTKNDTDSQAEHGDGATDLILIERKTFNTAQDQDTLDSMTDSWLSQRANPLSDLRVEPSMATKTFNPTTGQREVRGLKYEDVSVGDLVSTTIITNNRSLVETRRIAELTVDVDDVLNETLRFTLSKVGVFVTAAYLDATEMDDLKTRIKELEALV